MTRRTNRRQHLHPVVAEVAVEAEAGVGGEGDVAYRRSWCQTTLMINPTNPKAPSLRRMSSKRWFHRPPTRSPKGTTGPRIQLEQKLLLWIWKWLNRDSKEVRHMIIAFVRLCGMFTRVLEKARSGVKERRELRCWASGLVLSKKTEIGIRLPEMAL